MSYLPANSVLLTTTPPSLESASVHKNPWTNSFPEVSVADINSKIGRLIATGGSQLQSAARHHEGKAPPVHRRANVLRRWKRSRSKVADGSQCLAAQLHSRFSLWRSASKCFEEKKGRSSLNLRRVDVIRHRSEEFQRDVRRREDASAGTLHCAPATRSGSVTLIVAASKAAAGLPCPMHTVRLPTGEGQNYREHEEGKLPPSIACCVLS